MLQIEKKKTKEQKTATSRAEQRLESKLKDIKRQHASRIRDMEEVYSAEVKEEEERMRSDK
jgi:hypothetical protein